jgi:hypothetical protein
MPARPEAVPHAPLKEVTPEAIPVAMALIIEAPDCQAAAKQGLDLWRQRFPDSRVVMFLSWEIEAKEPNLEGHLRGQLSTNISNHL